MSELKACHTQDERKHVVLWEVPELTENHRVAVEEEEDECEGGGTLDVLPLSNPGGGEVPLD